MEDRKVVVSDSLEFLKQLKDFQADIVFADPPYALGSEVIIRQDGKVDYAKANDFMNKWEMPTGDYWGKWFIEAYRTLKHGGYLLMYGMDRQLLLFKYYASLAGFQEQQSIYWYYISNFPKATDLSNMIAKSEGAVRDGAVRYGAGSQGNTFPIKNIYQEYTKTDLAKKYDGYKYSVAPLKQTCETIMVFKKPNKTGSVLHDTLAMENGDDTITCSALNIDGNRVGTEKRTQFSGKGTNGDVYNGYPQDNAHYEEVSGRYPAQTFIDSQVAEKLDLQSGVSGGGSVISNNDVVRAGIKQDAPAFNSQNSGIDVNKGQGLSNYGDIGGCSKILHKCDYEKIDFDLFIYEPKVSGDERNNGLYDMEEKQYYKDTREGNSFDIFAKRDENGLPINGKQKNNHPTLKPIDLNDKILKLFKTPDDQVIIYPFAGSGSEIIGGLKANFQNWYACEINQDYVDIANARIAHYKEYEYVQIKLF